MSTVLITGAARGLGLDFTRQYAAKGWKVLACARKSDGLKGLKGDIHHHTLEVTDYKAVKALAKELNGEAIDVLICNAGVGGDREQRGQVLGAFDADEMRRIFEINTLAPLMMAEAFVEHVARSQQKKLIAITSILGSLANNNGGRYAYRASKTALNMEWNCLAKELAGRGRDLRCPASGLGADRHGRTDGDAHHRAERAFDGEGDRWPQALGQRPLRELRRQRVALVARCCSAKNRP